MGKKTNKRIKRSKRSKRKTFKGGMIPFVGSPLNYNIFSTYPGVSIHGGNHYGLNQWKKDLYTGNITDEGDFYIFPAHLTHMVLPFKSDVERISISGNIRVIVDDEKKPNNISVDNDIWKKISFNPEYL